MNEGSTTTKISKRMEFHPTFYLQVDRISKFVREMNQFSVRDIMKLETMIKDLESDLAFHIRITMKKKKDGIKMNKMGSINARLKKMDMFDYPKKYIELLLDKKAEIIYFAGMAEILPTYKDGMMKHER